MEQFAGQRNWTHLAGTRRAKGMDALRQRERLNAKWNKEMLCWKKLSSEI